MTDNTQLDDADALRERIAAELVAARDRTTLLTTAIDEADLVKQHSPLMSPLVWDLAHIANQEELWLLREVGGRDPLHPEIDPLYDAFEHPRAERPTLPLLAPGEARGYGHEVRGRVLDLLERAAFREAPAAFGESLTVNAFAFGQVAQHEVQHDETMLATHQLRVGPPVLAAPPPPPAPADAAALPAEVLVPGGPFTMGTSTEPWALDNERPAHEVHVAGFYLDTTPVTNAAYAAFIADGGYDNPRWWTTDGWAHRQRAGLTAPLFWNGPGGRAGVGGRAGTGEWTRVVFGREEPIIGNEPVLHVCWYEADAYARWAGRRLPTEAEWEKAARHDPATGRSRRYPWGDEDPTPAVANLGQRHLRPAPAGSYPAGAAPSGARQLIGDVWEWTSSDFLPYPGFTAWPYKEYSEVFFGPEYKVLRGGAFGVSPVAIRGTFRNWDYPIRRQIFAGFRTARSAPEGV
jgi:iron(II)-dependent oxidoreductase